MSRRVLAAALAVAAFLALIPENTHAGDPDGGPLKLRFNDGYLTWDDVDGEVAYRVYGEVEYRPDPSCISRLHIAAEVREFSEELSADTTTFALPLPSDRRLTWRKEWQITIEALGVDGQVIARDGVGATADKFCTPEELAAAGTGPGGGTDVSLPSALAVFGALALASGLALRRI